MTVHVSTPQSNYFFHSHELREMYVDDINQEELYITLCIPPSAIVPTYPTTNGTIVLTLPKAQETLQVLLIAIKQNTNMSITVKEFNII